MRVRNLGIIKGDPYPVLHLAVDGRDVYLGFDQQKPTLTLMGLVYLGEDFEAELPPIRVTVDNDSPLTLKGFTRDREVVRHFRAFLREINRIHGAP
jgi:hypothetical protein